MNEKPRRLSPKLWNIFPQYIAGDVQPVIAQKQKKDLFLMQSLNKFIIYIASEKKSVQLVVAAELQQTVHMIFQSEI